MLPPGWEGPEPWPFAVQAKQTLAALVESTTVELRFDARKEDRTGHVLAQVSVDRHGEPAWVEKALVVKGLVRVAALPDLGTCLGLLLAVEANTREAWREARSF